MYKQIVKHAMIMVMSGLLFGCAITGGLDAGQLPPVGSFVANNGVAFEVAELSMDNIPVVAQSTAMAATIPSHLYQKNQSYQYQVAIGDVLGIHLPAYPEITPMVSFNNTNPYATGFLVDQQGFIQFPLIGRVKVAGLTNVQVVDLLSKQLSRYLKRPDPQVRILAYRGNQFYIDGQVRNVGQYPIADQPVSLYSAISLAGGSLPTADLENITLIRNGETFRLGMKAIQNSGFSPHDLLIQQGDSLHIGNLTHNKIYVVGEFGKPSPVVIPDTGISLSAVLSEANLDRISANAAKVYVLRENPNGQAANIYYVNLKTMTNFALTNRFYMQPNDIVYVDPTGLIRWNRVISLLLPSTSLWNVAKGL